MSAYSVLADRHDFRIVALTCDILHPHYRDLSLVCSGLTSQAATAVRNAGLGNRTEADLRLRSQRIIRAIDRRISNGWTAFARQ